MDVRGLTALVTGASTGIGAAFARDLAARGVGLVLVARSRDRLEQLATGLRAAHDVRVDVVPADLARPGGATAVVERVADLGLTVDVLVNNAGFATHGDVAGADAPRLHEQVQLNATAVVDLTAALLPGMVARGTGAVVCVASTAAFQPVPHMAVYGATKAFVLSFTEALWAECAGTGVRVLALCPGTTDTPFFDVVGTTDARVGGARSPEQVVATAFRALDRGVPSVVDGRTNALVARLPRLLPRRAVLAVAGRAVRRRPAASPAREREHLGALKS